ncbi:hypothetical protein GCM10011348_14590 [Marinobacterium nitratireducens]|uniref:Lipoprotein n=1 Tax=Marinobacterium nitratireducens TaxID=518897 RepID=A0A917ZAG5_9GAMM|nr:DUF3299 domain-containing protein [Marinobacterium nitratireducens]GGO79691.1 hypothetical protein GCM10011348_14590 [Marinobacterium nitratireducens]
MKRLLASLCLLALCWTPFLNAADVLNGRAVETIDWEALMPPNFSFDQVYGSDDLSSLDDFDPAAQRKLDEMMQALSSAPVVASLDGRMVRLPGFVVPVEGEGQRVTSFFLVPWFGACIHTPPPPSNQIVYAHFEPGTELQNLYDAVWVTGVLRVETFSHELASAGYRLDAYRIEPYEE